jgi:hypothetical protein
LASNNNPSLTRSCVYFQIFKETVEELREIVDQQTKTFRTQVSVNKGYNVIGTNRFNCYFLFEHVEIRKSFITKYLHSGI